MTPLGYDSDAAGRRLRAELLDVRRNELPLYPTVSTVGYISNVAASHMVEQTHFTPL